MKKNIVWGLIASILIILNIVSLQKISDLKVTIAENKKSITDTLQQQTKYLAEALDMKWKVDKMEKNLRWVVDSTYKVVSVDELKETAKVSIKGSLKELEKNAAITITPGVLDGETEEVKKWGQKLPVAAKGLNFNADLILPYSENYSLKLEAADSKGSKSEIFIDVNLKTEIDKRIWSEFIMGPLATKESLFMQMYVYNSKNIDLDTLKIKNIDMNIYKLNEKVVTMPLIRDGATVEFKNTRENYKDSDNIVIRDDKGERFGFAKEIKGNYSEWYKYKVELKVEEYSGKIHTFSKEASDGTGQ